MPRDVAKGIQVSVDAIVEKGRQTLRKDMRNALPFCPQNPFPNYDDKNKYFERANELCHHSYWNEGLYDLCERYYQTRVAEIRAFEKDHTVNFNKGMVYANLGVSQVAQHKIDEGFANILKAHMEDEPYHKTDSSKSVFRLSLYTQFEKESVRYLLEHSKTYEREEATKLDELWLDGLISSLETDSHILFISLMEKIKLHLQALDDKDNNFSRLQVFLLLQDLCLCIENALKKKNRLTGTLKPALDNLFSKASGRKHTWKTVFDKNYNLTKSDSSSQLEINLRSVVGIQDNQARRLLILSAIRNFSSHNIDVRNSYVFANIKLIFESIISSLFFLRSQGCV
jgi:hypothetical protein